MPGEKEEKVEDYKRPTIIQIDRALGKIKEMIRDTFHQKEKDNLIKLYAYIFRNLQGITNLKDKEIERIRVIESNVRKAISTRFKKRGMNWSKKGALSLLKIKETILNNEWNDWWKTERERNIKIAEFKPPLSASYFNKAVESSPIVGKSTCSFRTRSGQTLGGCFA